MSEVEIGIDLGTTNRAAAYVDKSGKPTIIPNADGHPTTPSAIYFEDDGNPIVGQNAIGMLNGFSDRTVRWIKRQMGNPRWRFTLPEGRSYSAVDLSAIILGKLRADSEAFLGTSVCEAVITVPAYFDEVHRASTMKAAEQAGLRVKRLINEPSAAAIAFAHSKGGVESHYFQAKPARILIYDFGGGTFDVSVVDVLSNDHIIVRASDGVHWLGGYDLDVELAKHYNACLRRSENVCIQEGKPEWLKLVTDAERDKCSLSKMRKVRGRAQFDDRFINIDVTQAEYRELIRPYVTQTKMEIDIVLRDARTPVHEIEHVVLVGGSTRSPLVREMLKDVFGREPVQTLNVDESVAIGAAIEASRTVPTVSDVASHSYGTIVRADKKARRAHVNVVLIEKNTSIPAQGQQTFYTKHANQRRINCRVTQGDGSDPSSVVKLTSEHMQLSPGLPVRSPIDVSFSYDANMRMQCTFKERSSGRTKHIELNPFDGSPGSEEIDEALPAKLDSSGCNGLRVALARAGSPTPVEYGTRVVGFFLGRSDKGRHESQTDICLLLIAMCVSASDGTMSNMEMEAATNWLSQRLSQVPEGPRSERIKSLDEALPQLLRQLHNAYRSGKVIELLQDTCRNVREIAKRPKELALEAIDLCLRVALADEHFSQHEEQILAVASRALDVTPEYVENHCQSINFDRDIAIPKGLSFDQSIDYLKTEYRRWRGKISHDCFAVRGKAIGRLRSVVHARSRLEAQRENKTRTIFISHATADRPFVENTLLGLLKEHGMEVWYSRESIKTGTDWEKSIKRGLKESAWFLVVLSPRAVASEWVGLEVHWALKERSTTFVPILIDDCDPFELNAKLLKRQFVDFTGDHKEAAAKLFALWNQR